MRKPNNSLVLFLALVFSNASGACSAAESSSPQAAPGKPPVKKSDNLRPFLVVYPFRVIGEDKFGHRDYFRKLISGRAVRSHLADAPVEIDYEEAFENRPFDPNAVAGLEELEKKVLEHAAVSFETADFICGGQVTEKPGSAVSARIFMYRKDAGDEFRKIAEETYDIPNIEQAPLFVSKFLEKTFGKHEHLGITPDFACRVVSPNLVKNPGFENLAFSEAPKKTSGLYPVHWVDASEEQKQWGRLTRPVKKSEIDPKADGWCLELQPNKRMANVYGLIVYSDIIPIKQGKYYRVQVDCKSTGSKVIVFIKGFGEHKGLRGVEERMTYKFQVRPEPDPPRGKGWVHITSRPFLPRHPRDTVEYVKVMLYVYTHPGKKVWFDNVVFEEVVPEGRTQEADFENSDRSTKGWKKGD